MRILMVSHGYPPILSGVTLVVQKVARAMVDRGHQVTVITASDRGHTYEDQDRGVRLIRLQATANPFWKEGPIPWVSQNDLDEILEETEPHILHAQEQGLLGLQLVRANEEADLPAVASCYYVPRFAARYLTWNDEPQEIVENVVLAYSNWLLNHFDQVVFSTAAHREFFAGEGLDVPAVVISNGVDVRRYHPGRDGVDDVLGRYRLPPRPRILFVSRLARDKEIDVLIQAMPALWAAHRAHLLLVGRGDDRQRMEALSSDLGLEHCVHFMGFVPEADLPALYRACDLFAIASICEVQSLPTLQAAATGLPLVAADAVALPELAHDGVNGHLVPPGDPQAMAEAMARILGEPALAASMGQESLSIARAHAESRTFDLYEDLYRRTLQIAGKN